MFIKEKLCNRFRTIKRIRDRLHIRKTITLFVSYPKCGRTWVKEVLKHYNKDLNIFFTHDKELIKSFEGKLVTLIRCSKDVQRSYYHHMKDRTKQFKGSFEEFKKEYPLEMIDKFQEELIKAKGLCLEYERLYRFQYHYFKMLIDYLDLPFNETKLKQSLEHCSKSNMRNREIKRTGLKGNELKTRTK